MNPYVYYVLWGTLLVGAALWSVILLVRKHDLETRISKVALIVPLVSSIASLSTFVCFTLVFIVGKSSNVAQLAQGGGMNWWSFWFDIFLPSIFGNFALLAITGILSFCRPILRGIGNRPYAG
jgi:ABC-type glycerol-3-phosphate transport system permease component